jgi:hypothetical protein
MDVQQGRTIYSDQRAQREEVSQRYCESSYEYATSQKRHPVSLQSIHHAHSLVFTQTRPHFAYELNGCIPGVWRRETAWILAYLDGFAGTC